MRVLDAMTDTLRIPLMLRDADGLSYDEIAGQLGIGLSAVKIASSAGARSSGAIRGGNGRLARAGQEEP